jgi:hypothetical protein
MRKKTTWIIIFIIFIILFLLIVKPFRTMGVMESIAKEKLMEEGPLKLFSDNDEPIYKGIEGPIVTDRGERVEYRWYKVLEWGDTASISAFVYKNFLKEFSGSFRKKNPPSVTADGKWYYVYVPEGISKFADALPLQHKKGIINSSKIKLYQGQNEIADSIQFIVKPSRLFYFLQKGYFSVVEKDENYIIVDFYEPIANIVHKHTKDSISTMSAKVFLNDSLEVLIIPYDVPIEVRNKK